jgi:hypothetical protein
MVTGAGAVAMPEPPEVTCRILPDPAGPSWTKAPVQPMAQDMSRTFENVWNGKGHLQKLTINKP